MALNCLMSCSLVNAKAQIKQEMYIDLFQRLVVDKARSILWNVQLALLEMFTEFPEWQASCQAREQCSSGRR